MARKKLTDEEKRERKNESQRRWIAKNPEYRAAYYQVNRDKVLERQKQYRAEHKDEIAERKKQWRAEHKEEKAEYDAKYYQEHKEEIAKYKTEYQSKYYKTPIGRAVYIVGNYKRNDKKYNRGKCTLTAQWVADNIFSKPCHYCGAIGWEIMGCDRIDNSLPHTLDNVVPCCRECNLKRQEKEYEEFKKEMEGNSPLPS